jgi:hypothetical protein
MAIYNVGGEERDFVGIGKMMIDTKTVTWNIPHLHFLVSRNSGYFEAICLEFGLVSTGDTQEDSAKRLIEHTIYYIGAVINNGNGFEEFKDLALNKFMIDYWGTYQHIEFCLAETKQDLSHEFENLIENRIIKALQELFDQKVKELIAVAENAIDDAIKEYEKMSAFKINSIRYSTLEVAA